MRGELARGELMTVLDAFSTPFPGFNLYYPQLKRASRHCAHSSSICARCENRSVVGEVKDEACLGVKRLAPGPGDDEGRSDELLPRCTLQA